MFSTWIFRTGSALVLVVSSIALAAAADTHNDADPSPLFAGQTAPPALARFVAAGWQLAPERKAGEAAVLAAEARLNAAGQPLYNPELSLEAERAEVDTKTIGISQAIDLGRKGRLAAQAARLEMTAARADLVGVRQDFAAALLENLARYQGARQQQALARKRTMLMQQFADGAAQRLAAGDIGPLDVSLAKVAYANAQIAQAGAERGVSQAAAALTAITGSPAGGWPDLPGRLPNVSPRYNLAGQIDHLPSVQALTARAAAQIQTAKQADRQRIPDPTLGLTGGREGQESLIGLSLSIPLPVRNSYRAEARAAAHEAVQGKQLVLTEKRQAAARIEGALAAYRVARQAWQVWQQSGQDSLTEQVALLQQLWEAGDIAASDYLIQASQNVETQAAAAALAGEVWSAALELLHVTGSLDSWLTLADAPH